MCTAHWLCERTDSSPCLFTVEPGGSGGSAPPDVIPAATIRELRLLFRKIDPNDVKFTAGKSLIDTLVKRVKDLADETARASAGAARGRCAQLIDVVGGKPEAVTEEKLQVEITAAHAKYTAALAAIKAEQPRKMLAAWNATEDARADLGALYELLDFRVSHRLRPMS